MYDLLANDAGKFEAYPWIRLGLVQVLPKVSRHMSKASKYVAASSSSR